LRHAEFDKFADEYLASHAANVRISGEDPAYFARYKIVELRRMWTRRRLVEPAAVLDFGSGIGASLPHLAVAFPDASLTAFDVSARSLAIAEGRFPNIATFVHGDNPAIFPKASFDLVFTSCVFHHVDETQHVDLFRQLHGLLRPNGAVVVFEHNPVNPITRYIVATCPFDEQREAGFKSIETRYTGFFPHALARLRWLEPYLSALPMGAQYYTTAHA
jgi:trans-aconitate methyltransferase